jgi:Protein of unknown function (DUF2924)
MKSRDQDQKSMEQISTVASKIATLSVIKMPELWKLWDQHFKERPTHPNRRHLESRLTYRLQEIAFGGLKPATRDLLANFGERLSSIKTSTRPINALLPGTILIREFNGRDHRVTVTIDGKFEYGDHKYPSLSSVARQITGTQWSGPAFFGLTQRGKK